LNTFSQLGLSPKTVEVLEKIGFKSPTPVQEKAIPQLLSPTPIDFIGLAQTGTGKTAAFGLPLIELIDSDNPNTQALIMAPTRELGQQIAQQLVSFSQNHRINIEVVYGGAAISNQIKALKRPTQIVVATPGRLIDLIGRKAIRLDQVQYVVLDEADEMLNMGFKEDIDDILSFTPSNRVTWLFSATMPSEIRRIVSKYMKNPAEVSIDRQEQTNKDITHKYIITKTSNKLAALRRFLDIQPEMRGVMFCRTKRETQEIADELSTQGYAVEALHGDLSQQQRDMVMKRFKTRSMQLLIATDVAARGIDVNDLTHVIHHTLPDQMESYTHRSGRTGRAGKKGISLVFINPREARKITDLERRLKVSFEKIEIPNTDELVHSRINNWAKLIVNTKIDNDAEPLLIEVQGLFADLSKEDILKRLITTQLDHLNIKGGGDLNETKESRGKNETKARRGGDNSQANRYFINVGSIDGFAQGDLLHFLADITETDRKHFNNISFQKNCSYFDVDKGKDSNLSNKFDGIEIDGRAIRVNRDDDDGPRRKPKSDSGGYNRDNKKFKKTSSNKGRKRFRN